MKAVVEPRAGRTGSWPEEWVVLLELEPGSRTEVARWAIVQVACEHRDRINAALEWRDR